MTIEHTRRLGTVTAHTGVVDVTNQVVAYQRRRLGTGEVLAEFPLDLPARQLRTRAVWLTLDDRAVERAEVDDVELPGSLHAAEHAAIGILPLLATCDRWDLGGLSTALHPDTGTATIFVYDGHPGGAGFSERGFAVLRRWLQATRATVASCECESGCPSCVQSPKCGNGNDPLDKAGAVRVLDVVLDELAAAEGPGRGADEEPRRERRRRRPRGRRASGTRTAGACVTSASRVLPTGHARPPAEPDRPGRGRSPRRTPSGPAAPGTLTVTSTTASARTVHAGQVGGVRRRHARRGGAGVGIAQHRPPGPGQGGEVGAAAVARCRATTAAPTRTTAAPDDGQHAAERQHPDRRRAPLARQPAHPPPPLRSVRLQTGHRLGRTP